MLLFLLLFLQFSWCYVGHFNITLLGSIIMLLLGRGMGEGGDGGVIWDLGDLHKFSSKCIVCVLCKSCIIMFHNIKSFNINSYFI